MIFFFFIFNVQQTETLKKSLHFTTNFVFLAKFANKGKSLIGSFGLVSQDCLLQNKCDVY